MERSREYYPRGRNMSTSSEYGHSRDYRYRSPSRFSHYNKSWKDLRSPNFQDSCSFYHDFSNMRQNNGGSDCESNKENPWESSFGESKKRSPKYFREHSRSEQHNRERGRSRDHYSSRERRYRNDPPWVPGSESRIHDQDGSCQDDWYSVKREPSPYGTVTEAGRLVINESRKESPNNTIVIRGLAQYFSENDIRRDIIHCGLMPKDIRLIRSKDTGASRGFAFVEFSTLPEAKRWMQLKQGVLILKDFHHQEQVHATVQYCTPKNFSAGSEKPASHNDSEDWHCIKCGGQNFKKREACFKCRATRTESEEGGSGADEISTYATKTILIRNLDALTTEGSVLSALNNLIPHLVKSISAVRIGRDPLTSTSRGICYLGTENTSEAWAIHSALSCLPSPLKIDRKTVILSYCKYVMGDNQRAYAQPDNTNADFPNASVPDTYNLTDIERLAEYAARRYAKNDEEYQHYVAYYKSYWAEQISAGNSITLHQENQMDAANAAAAVAQSAIQQMQANKKFYDSTHMTMPNGTDKKIYPVPDISNYTYDNATGYQYDSSTGLYYDLNSKYYWNSVIQRYLYWDQGKMTYVLAPDYSTQQAIATLPLHNQEPEMKKQKVGKADKVKVAKKIAQDMERWAKTLKQKKEAPCSRRNISMPSNSTSSAAADVGFSVMEKITVQNQIVPPAYKNEQPEEPLTKTSANSATYTASAPLLVAAYGESDSSGDEESIEEFHPVSASVTEPIGSDNIGSRLLQKMGWSEGQGLGRLNQGTTEIIQAKQRSDTAGLGTTKVAGYTAGSGESYKDCVKRIMYSRYQNLIGLES